MRSEQCSTARTGAAVAVYVDGGCTGNAQKDPARRQMVAVVTDDAGAVLCEQTAAGGSNNVAELWAVVEACEWAVRQGMTEVDIVTDSQNNFAWVFNRHIGKHLNDRAAVEALRDRLRTSLARLSMKLVWVPRDGNVAGHYIERRYQL